jgi:hypothetical protein
VALDIPKEAFWAVLKVSGSADEEQALIGLPPAPSSPAGAT